MKEKYEVNSNTKFSTYAFLWIRGEILEYLRNDKNIKVISKNIESKIKIENQTYVSKLIEDDCTEEYEEIQKSYYSF